MGKSDAFPTRGKSLKRKKFLLVAPPGTAVQQNSQRGPTEYWIGLRNPYVGRWVPPAGVLTYRGIRALPKIRLREARTHEGPTEADVCMRGGDDGFDCGIFASVPEAIYAAGAAYEKRN